MKYLLGYDIGSSSIKASLLDIDTGKCVAAAASPKQEMEIAVPQAPNDARPVSTVSGWSPVRASSGITSSGSIVTATRS